MQIPYRPSNYVAELEEFRRELLTAARDYGRDVRTSVDCALREIGNPGRFSEYTHQIYLLAERLATNINVLLAERFQSGPGDSEDRRLILAMQLRAQALYLYILMGSGMCFPLTEIESVEYYRRNFDTGPDSRDIVTEHWDELVDPNPTLDLVRIRDDLRREIHFYDLTIQELSELIESPPGSSLAPIVPNSGGSASPAAGANSTPFIEPAVENSGPGCGERDDLTRAWSRHVVERTEVADREDENVDSPVIGGNPNSETTVDSPVIGGNPNSETTTGPDLNDSISQLRETKLAVICSLLHHGPMVRNDILRRIQELDCDPQPGTLTNHLTQLSRIGLIENFGVVLWRLVPPADACLTTSTSFPRRVTTMINLARSLWPSSEPE